MVPVELKLTNFLSYGTAAPALDFEQFHVACLSGRNGQGKSALLDAVTWALWGEARKSSDSRKPDDELLRLGTRHMQVDLVFDVEGVRYRVVRSYQKSASGKTAKPTLELHVFEPATGGYRPLTGGSIRETQQALTNVLGLDYGTFINSAFLLQGRSDEFTKKRPSERKEILGRILDLARYDHLAQLARQREREVAARIQQSEHEMERLHEAVREEATWKEELRLTDAQLEEAQARLGQLRTREQAARAQLLRLDAQAEEAQRIQATLQRLQKDQAQAKQQIEMLDRRLTEARRLLGQREQIQRDYEQYQRLLKEREVLDEKQVLFRAIEKQVQAKETEIHDRRVEQEKRLHVLEVELKSTQKEANACELQLAEVPSIRRQLEDAKGAKERYDQQVLVAKQRAELEGHIQRLEQELLGKRKALQGEADTLAGQIREEEVRLSTVHHVERQLKEAQRRAEQQREQETMLQELVSEGQKLNEAMKERSGRNQVVEAALAKREQALHTFRQGDDGTCPVCGTALSEHRQHQVERDFEQECETLRQNLSEGRAWVVAKKEEVARLRQRFRTLKQDVEAGKAVVEQVATFEAQLNAHKEARQAMQAKQARLAELRKTLETKAFGQKERAQRRQYLEQLKALPFDEQAFERLQVQANQVIRFTERLRDLQEVAGRHEQLAQRIASLSKRVDEQRRQLTKGTGLEALKKHIAMLLQQLQQVGFDARRFEEVRLALKEVAYAGAKLQELVNAQQNQSHWQDQRATEQKRLADIDVEQRQRLETMQTIEAALRERPQKQQALRDAEAEGQTLNQTIQTFQQQRGQLTAKLSQARADREALKRQRHEQKVAQRQRSLLKHVRAAFGKHGIPSLIIEQTLPEIEERANELLDRLSDGRMHVRLETIKDKKTGGTKETLDIVITDEQGAPRSYETFSGGEAFRVNFALRIALAQLLAERSGVRIRTLFIDEGFGTQDAQGVQNLVEAIQIIQNDFDKIVVITHLDQLKEAFPVRIEVEKSPVEGSRFELIGV